MKHLAIFTWTVMQFAVVEVAAQSTNPHVSEWEFDDIFFDQCVREYADARGWANVSEVIYLFCTSDDIRSVEGIDIFYNLTQLGLYDTKIAEIDVNEFPELNKLYIRGSELDSIDLSDNPNLDTLAITNSNISEIDLSENAELEQVELDSMGLAHLDISNLTRLRTLWLNNNFISSLILPEDANLRTLSVYNNALTQLDLTNHQQISLLDIGFNLLSDLDITNLSQLTRLSADGLPIVELDLSSNSELNYINLNYSSVRDLALPQGSKLEQLYLYGTDIRSLDIRNIKELTALAIGGVRLYDFQMFGNLYSSLEFLGIDSVQSGVIDIYAFPNLKELYLYDYYIPSFEGAEFSQLEELLITGGLLSEINLASNASLRELSLDENKLTDIELESNSELQSVSLRRNGISSIADIDDLRLLTAIDMSENPLSSSFKAELDELADDGVNVSYGYKNRFDYITEVLSISAVKWGDSYFRMELELTNVDSLEFTLLEIEEIADPNEDVFSTYDGENLQVIGVEVGADVYQVEFSKITSSADEVFRLTSAN